MALNMDKLEQLRRQNPQPKFAFDRCQKLLKKQKGDPYLMAWYTELTLRKNTLDQKLVLTLLESVINHKPLISDMRYFSYLYQIFAEAKRKTELNRGVMNSIGDQPREAWQNAARQRTNRKDRLSLWSNLFFAALKEECWEDVLWALTQINLEKPQEKKTIAYTLVLANQLASEKMQADEHGDKKKAKMLAAIAQLRLTQAFRNALKPSDDPLRIQDMRDLRFMAEIFRRQGRQNELIDLWRSAAGPVKDILDKHKIEIVLLRLSVLTECDAWETLYECIQYDLNEALAFHRDNPAASLGFPLTYWEVWQGYLRGIQKSFDPLTAESLVAKTLEQISPFNSREIELARLALTASYAQDFLLGLCKSHWKSHSGKGTCFQDLRRFVDQLKIPEQKEFVRFITESSKELISKSGPDTEASARKWIQEEINAMKLIYMLTISRPKKADEDEMIAFVTNALRLYKIGIRINDECSKDAAVLAITVLNVLDRTLAARGKTFFASNRRFGFQACYLIRHLTAGETGKQQRPLLLMSTQMHLNLGLATVAFNQYRHARVKEILNDTVSYFLLTDISQLHPFDQTNVRDGFSPNKELMKVIETIERMESRVDDFLYQDIQDFKYDQAVELIEFKRKLKFSLTKHLCMIERRRIARLTGEQVDGFYNFRLADLGDLYDNRDFDVIPEFESTVSTVSTQSILHRIPDGYWVLHWQHGRELPFRIAMKEINDTSTAEMLRIYDTDIEGKSPDGYASISNTEMTFDDAFERAAVILKAFIDRISGASDVKSVEAEFECLGAEIKVILEETIRMFRDSDEETDPEDSWWPHRGVLHWWYGLYELLILCRRTCERMREIQKSFKVSAGKKEVDPVGKVEDIIVFLYGQIQVQAKGMLTSLKRQGRTSVLTKAREGPTGELIREIIGDGEMQALAEEYVESAIDALDGVLKVKTKK